MLKLSFSHNTHSWLFADIAAAVKYILSFQRILMRMSKAQATIGDWIALSKVMLFLSDLSTFSIEQSEK